jgi:hypothetical protein
MIRLGVEIIRRMITSKQVFDKALFSATSFIKGSISIWIGRSAAKKYKNHAIENTEKSNRICHKQLL